MFECIMALVFFQVFDDACKSQLSCVVVDDIERLLGEFTRLLFVLQTHSAPH